MQHGKNTHDDQGYDRTTRISKYDGQSTGKNCPCRQTTHDPMFFTDKTIHGNWDQYQDQLCVIVGIAHWTSHTITFRVADDIQES